MTYQVLSRKLRPKLFQEVIGQEHVVRSLSNAVKMGRIGHAYLFSGTRGVGKTTIARIFAKAIRCEVPQPDGNPCNQCRPCLDFTVENSMDIMEVDGASNNSVENVREIISNVQYLPTSGKYRIYIIDEVHMLSNSAFNALLKTLEEPPKHVVFIFATTEPQKIPATIISRSQRFDFKTVSFKELMKFIQDVSKKEQIHFGGEKVLKEIATQGNGSVRDTLSLIDLVLSFASGKDITEEVLVQSIGMAKSSTIEAITYNVLSGHVSEVSKNYRELLADNVPILSVLRSLLDLFFNMIEHIDDDAYEHKEILKIISYPELFWIYEVLAKDSVWVLETIDPEKVFEILLQKITLRRNFFTTEFNLSEVKKKTLPEVSDHPQELIVDKEPPPASKTETINDEELIPENFICTEEVVSPGDFSNENKIEKNWDQFIHFLYKKSPASASNLEQGNIIKPLNVSENGIFIELGFKESEKVFFDYLNETTVYKKLKENLADFFQKKLEDIHLKIFLVDEVQKKEYNFQSRVEITQEKIEEELECKKQELLSHENIKEAERLFGVSIGKITLKNQQGRS